MNHILNVCINAVTEASAVCRTVQNRMVRGDTLVKNDRSPVTIADFASQAIVCRILKQTFPEIPIVGEEDSNDLKREKYYGLLRRVSEFLPDFSEDEIVEAVESGSGTPGPSFFTLDPIDGTKGFLRGDQYAVALSLIRDGRVDLGVLGCPNLSFDGSKNKGIIAYAQRDRGAFARLPGRDAAEALHVSGRNESSVVRFLESVEPGHADHALQAVIKKSASGRSRSVRMDSQAKYVMLAGDRAEVYLRIPSPKTPHYKEKIWDHAAGSIIVEEAGGKVTDMTGKDLDFSTGHRLLNNTGVIGTNGLFHDSLVGNLADQIPTTGSGPG